MIRLIALAVVLAIPPTCSARPQDSPAQQPPPVRLTLHPMPAPVPALKFYLLPQVRDKQRGNALLLYYRAFSPELQGHRRDPQFLKKLTAAASKPLRELKRAEVDDLVRRSDALLLQEVDRGARRTYCDWELTQPLREEGIGLRLPDLQSLREVASLLKLRARKELLAGRYDQAARTLQTGLALGRHVAAGPTLIHSLVAIACVRQMLEVIEDWIDRPDAPNLYWAMTNLPKPLISLRNGLEGERITIDWLCPGYREFLDDPAAPPKASARAILQTWTAILESDSFSPLEPLFIVLKTYPRAKRFLRQQGRSAKEVESMPALQAVFLYEVHQYDVTNDELRKWANLPYHLAAPRVQRVVQQMKEAEKQGRSSIAFLLVAAIHKVLAAPARIERKVAALRCVEALRLHAAAHGGKLPALLDEVTEVPIPLDPWTGKAFDYRRAGETATLSGPPLPGEKADASNTIRYELTMRTAKGK